ncbi:MAG: hypothetical protein QF876_13240 [Desulfobacterales bacterium]|nr:hypothetical protein [Desulfobacterales bacterium]MDP6808786.1 hypothetical protein [Desulfobacterales bacterium]
MTTINIPAHRHVQIFQMLHHRIGFRVVGVKILIDYYKIKKTIPHHYLEHHGRFGRLKYGTPSITPG